MNAPTSKKVLIKTLNLHNGNYGGILQNYALQQVLASLGFNAWTDASLHPGLDKKLKHAMKPLARRFALPSRLPVSLAGHYVNAELDDFIGAEIRTCDLYGVRGPRASTLAGFDAFVAGSDQIWRHDYTSVTANLLDFADGLDVPKIAYAGSFGTSGMDGYTQQLMTRSRHLAQQLTAISVREASAVQLCASEWGVEATHVLDPTMLLEPATYDALIMERPSRAPTGNYVFDYTLDASPASKDFTSRVADRIRADVRHGMPPWPPSFSAAKRSPATYAKPSVREWLRGFRDAEFVVTDSFHGTVFSILFERPFVSVLNSSRGAERFHSLLTMFGLQDRLVGDGNVSQDLSLAPDWSRVRERLDAERATSLAFLCSALGASS